MRSGVTAGLLSRLNRSWLSIAYATCSRDAGRERGGPRRRDNAHLRKARPPSSPAMCPPHRRRPLPSGRRRDPPGHRSYPRCGRGHQLQPPSLGARNLPTPWKSTSTDWLRRSRILIRRSCPKSMTARSKTAETKSSTGESRGDRRSQARRSRTGIWIWVRPTSQHCRRPIPSPQMIPIARPLLRRSHEPHQSQSRHRSDRRSPRHQSAQPQPQPRRQPDQ